ncbi:MAG: hypothetical protein WA194_00015 [Patescibacteria group bacterium]
MTESTRTLEWGIHFTEETCTPWLPTSHATFVASPMDDGVFTTVPAYDHTRLTPAIVVGFSGPRTCVQPPPAMSQ